MTSDESQEQFIGIWKKIAAHYKDEPVILGYDLLNEPIATHFVDEERRKLVPNNAHKTDLKTLVAEFGKLAQFLNMKLKCNYLLINYPWGGGNYDAEHLEALTQLLDPETSRIKLTSYSETGKGYTSPDPEKFEEIGEWLRARGYEVQIKKLLGSDIFAACGMLHYENPHQKPAESLVQLGRPESKKG